MIIVLKPEATKKDAQEIIRRIAALGLKPLYMPGTERTVLGAIGDERIIGKLRIENHPLVERVSPVLTPYKLVSREIHPRDTVVRIGGVPLGGNYFAVIAGPCAVESPRQMLLTAQAVKRAGAKCLRGGAYKPRTSPYSFQGLVLEGLEILRDVAQRLQMPAVTEVVEVADVAAVERYASAFQVGARNMQNFRLLKALGQSRKPVILKRGMAATVDDLLLAAEPKLGGRANLPARRISVADIGPLRPRHGCQDQRQGQRTGASQPGEPMGCTSHHMISVRSPPDFTPSDAEGNTCASRPIGWGSVAWLSMPLSA